MWIIGMVIILLLFLAGWNHKLHVQYYQIKNNKVKKPLRIVHLSDLHGCLYGMDQEDLLHLIIKENPDLILMSGDMFDEKMDFTPVKQLFHCISNVCPCYFVSGNHEYKAGIHRMKRFVMENGIHLLEDAHVYLPKQQINICGVDDPYLKLKSYGKSLEDAFEGVDTSVYTILLAHRPERIHTHLRFPCDLILSGHAHGGQWRIPFLFNGLYAPQQGIFPRYAGGMYVHDNQVHIVNRGMAVHIKIPRIYNRPEIVVIHLQKG